MVKYFSRRNNVFIIAEIGLNHRGRVDLAIEHVNKAVDSGCDAVKFQTYKTETRIQDRNSSLFPLLKELELSYADFEKIKNHCDKKKIVFFFYSF